MEPQAQSRSLQDLVAVLAHSRDAVAADVQAFPAVDAEDVARDLNLYVRAAEAGQHDQPPAGARTPDAIEQEIAAAIERRGREAGVVYRSQLALHDARVQRAALTTAERAEVEAAVEAALAELDVRVRASLAQLHDVWRETVAAIDMEFQAFRSHHGLSRPPKLVSRGGKLLRTVLLAAVAAVGTMLNARLFADGSAASMAWTVQALAWSLANVCGAAAYARTVLSQLMGRGFGSKLLGVASSCVFIAWVVGMNLVATHVRDVFVAPDVQVTFMEVWRHVTVAPLGLDAPTSWLLLVLGLGTSAAAVVLAAGMGELYPGYGELGARRAAAEGTYREAESSCSDHLTEVRGAVVEDIRAAIENMRDLESQANAAADARNRLHLQFMEHLDDLAESHAYLCKRYREVNGAVRSSKAPAYFGRAVKRPALIEAPALPPLAHPPQDTWAEAIGRMEHYAATVQSALAAELPRAEAAESAVAEVEEAVTV
jgi:hypothetical protein